MEHSLIAIPEISREREQRDTEVFKRWPIALGELDRSILGRSPVLADFEYENEDEDD
jgi:hypothetical protein